MEKLKHLEFIQATIERMSRNSFLIKGWGLTLITALVAVAETNSNVSYIFIAYSTIIIFWILDGYFLSQERLFRALYEDVRKKEKIDFSMSVSKLCDGDNTWLKSIFSNTLIIFYLLVSVIMLSTAFLLSRNHG